MSEVLDAVARADGSRLRWHIDALDTTRHRRSVVADFMAGAHLDLGVDPAGVLTGRRDGLRPAAAPLVLAAADERAATLATEIVYRLGDRGIRLGHPIVVTAGAVRTPMPTAARLDLAVGPTRSSADLLLADAVTGRTTVELTVRGDGAQVLACVVRANGHVPAGVDVRSAGDITVLTVRLEHACTATLAAAVHEVHVAADLTAARTGSTIAVRARNGVRPRATTPWLRATVERAAAEAGLRTAPAAPAVALAPDDAPLASVLVPAGSAAMAAATDVLACAVSDLDRAV